MKDQQEKDLPLVSIIIPTYNEEEYIGRCLKSLFSQEYPKEKIEVIVVDDHSNDKTVEIANAYEVEILKNGAKDAEYGKYLGFKHSKGKIIGLLDADNIIVSDDWLSRMIQPLLDEGDILGVESNYLVGNDFSSINTYCALLVVVDPLARLLASKPNCVNKKKDYILKFFEKGSRPVAGANGFLWRRSIIEKYNDKNDRLSETPLLFNICKSENVVIANVPGIGVYHYYADSLKDYFNKRKKIAKKHLNRENNQEEVWVKRDVVFYSKVFYLATFIGPCVEATKGYLKSGMKQWFFHPFIAFATIALYVVFHVRNLIYESK